MAILVLVLAGCCDLVTSFQVTRSQLVITQTQMAIEEIRFIAWHKRWLSTKILKVWVILHHYILVIFAGNSIKKMVPPSDSCMDIYHGKNITAECLSAVWCVALDYNM